MRMYKLGFKAFLFPFWSFTFKVRAKSISGALKSFSEVYPSGYYITGLIK